MIINVLINEWKCHGNEWVGHENEWKGDRDQWVLHVLWKSVWPNVA
jgi:hypothetical protein